jgi:hypothetical protein
VRAHDVSSLYDEVSAMCIDHDAHTGLPKSLLHRVVLPAAVPRRTSPRP